MCLQNGNRKMMFRGLVFMVNSLPAGMEPLLVPVPSETAPTTRVRYDGAAMDQDLPPLTSERLLYPVLKGLLREIWQLYW
jgi:hypothetical protein